VLYHNTVQTLCVKCKGSTNQLEDTLSPVPLAVIAIPLGLPSLRISPPLRPCLSSWAVYHGLPYQKGSASQRLTGAFTVHCGVSRRNVRGATDYRSDTQGSCWGSHDPRPMVSVGEPTIINDCTYGHTANRAWEKSSTHASRVALLKQSVRRVAGKDGAFARPGASRCHDRQESIYPTAYTSPNPSP